jgi:hypothetical protein
LHTPSVLFGMMLGYLVYHGLSFLLNIGDASKWFRRNEAAILKILVAVVESVAFIQAAKLKQMKILGFDDATIRLTASIDKQSFDGWKSNVNDTLNNYYKESGRKPHYDFSKLLAHAEEIWRKHEKANQ